MKRDFLSSASFLGSSDELGVLPQTPARATLSSSAIFTPAPPPLDERQCLALLFGITMTTRVSGGGFDMFGVRLSESGELDMSKVPSGLQFLVGRIKKLFFDDRREFFSALYTLLDARQHRIDAYRGHGTWSDDTCTGKQKRKQKKTKTEKTTFRFIQLFSSFSFHVE
jgi:hypothetical protein